MEKVSVIVPIYNVEDYLEECINSIINQTYKNLEIILVDDGSKDSSGKMCDNYQKKDDRIRVFHKKNGGLSDARNEGIKRATGKYICFVDSDDYIENNYIELLYNNIKKFNVKISVASYRYVFEDGNIKNFEMASELMLKSSAMKKLFYENAFGNYAWNKMYDINLFNDIKFPIGRKMEDLGIMYLLIEKCSKIYFDSSIIYNYRQRKNSIVHNINKNFLVDRLDLTIERFEHFKKNYAVFDELYVNLISICLDTYEYLYFDDYYSKICLNYLNSKELKKYFFELNLKKKIKFLCLKLNKKLYIKFFKKVGDCVEKD